MRNEWLLLLAMFVGKIAGVQRRTAGLITGMLLLFLCVVEYLRKLRSSRKYEYTRYKESVVNGYLCLVIFCPLIYVQEQFQDLIDLILMHSLNFHCRTRSYQCHLFQCDNRSNSDPKKFMQMLMSGLKSYAAYHSL